MVRFTPFAAKAKEIGQQRRVRLLETGPMTGDTPVKTHRSKQWLFSWLTKRAKRRRPALRGSHFLRPWRLEQLEDRVLPTVIDLTTAGASGEPSGAIFSQFTASPGGSGAFNTFVRLNSNNALEQG